MLKELHHARGHDHCAAEEAIPGAGKADLIITDF